MDVPREVHWKRVRKGHRSDNSHDRELSFRMTMLLRYGKWPSGEKVRVTVDRAMPLARFAELLGETHKHSLHVVATSRHDDGYDRFMHYQNDGVDIISATLPQPAPAPLANDVEHVDVDREPHHRRR